MLAMAANQECRTLIIQPCSFFDPFFLPDTYAAGPGIVYKNIITHLCLRFDRYYVYALSLRCYVRMSQCLNP